MSVNYDFPFFFSELVRDFISMQSNQTLLSLHVRLIPHTESQAWCLNLHFQQVLEVISLRLLLCVKVASKAISMRLFPVNENTFTARLLVCC